MFLKPEKDEILAAVNRLLAAATGITYGEILPYDVMEREFCVRRGEGNWNYLVKKFRKRFQQLRGMVFRPVENVGYRVCTQEEQAIDCMRQRKKRAIKQINRGIGEVDCGAISDLSPHMQQARLLGLNHAREERLAMLRTLREQEVAGRKSDVLPTRAK